MMDEKERKEMITELRERLDYFTDERLRLLYKSSKPVTAEDLRQDIERFSKNIR